MRRKRNAFLVGALMVSALSLLAAPTMSVASNHWCPGGGPCSPVPVCPESHPVVKDFAAKVGFGLDWIYSDMVTLAAKGYIPYFDIVFLGPVGHVASSFTHWLHPGWIEDDVLLDPMRPESILVDQWGRPMGMMFIAKEGQTPGPNFVDAAGNPALNSDGDVCYPPWHPHTDLPARYAWWHYKTVYAGQPGTVPDYTPSMAHIWHPKFASSIYSHNGPPNSQRGEPGVPPTGIVPPLSKPN